MFAQDCYKFNFIFILTNFYNNCKITIIVNVTIFIFQAEEALRGTLSSDKNEILFQEFNMNYNNGPEMFRKGTSLVRKLIVNANSGKTIHVVIPLYCDIISNKFWNDNPEIMGLGKLREFRSTEDIVVFNGTNLSASNELCQENTENFNEGQ